LEVARYAVGISSSVIPVMVILWDLKYLSYFGLGEEGERNKKRPLPTTLYDQAFYTPVIRLPHARNPPHSLDMLCRIVTYQRRGMDDDLSQKI